MTLYVLDTDQFTLFQRSHAKVLWNITTHASDDLAVTIITVEEQLTGWLTALRRAKTTAHLAAIYDRFADGVEHLQSFQILSFNLAATQSYDQLKAMKLGVQKMDLRIAAIALEMNATLVTRNIRDFQRVPGLSLQDWSV